MAGRGDSVEIRSRSVQTLIERQKAAIHQLTDGKWKPLLSGNRIKTQCLQHLSFTRLVLMWLFRRRLERAQSESNVVEPRRTKPQQRLYILTPYKTDYDIRHPGHPRNEPKKWTKSTFH